MSLDNFLEHIHELLKIEWRVVQEKKLAHGIDAAYLQGKADGLRTARAIFTEDKGAIQLIATSDFSKTHSIVDEQMEKDGVA